MLMAYTLPSLSFLVVISSVTIGCSAILLDPGHPVQNFTEIAASDGYKAVEHTVTTEDGYVLTIFQIVSSPNCDGVLRRPPVLMMHGLLLSSDSWLDSGPNASLAYLLSDECHDVWCGNVRGNNYGRRHTTLDPDAASGEFWQFSVDEIGRYDIPATIDYVLYYTRANKLNYVGFSQGSGAFCIMCSERPGYCEKAQLFISLASSGRHLNCKSDTYRLMTQFYDTSRELLATLGTFEVLKKGDPIQNSISFFCQMPLFYVVCQGGLSFLDSYHPGSISKKTIQVLFDHFPAGTSVKLMAHHGQSTKSTNFAKFDYGKYKNLLFYGTPNPPNYNLSAVTVPYVGLYGRNDGLDDIVDIKWFISKLPNVLYAAEVSDPLWNHFDNNFSQNTLTLTFPTIKKYLSLYSTQ